MIIIKKNVMRILFCMAMLFLALMVKSSVQAMTFTYNEVEHTVPDLPEVSDNFDGKHFSIVYGSSSNCYFLVTYIGYEEGVTYAATKETYGGRFYIFGKDGSDTGARFVVWKAVDGVWEIHASPTECYWYYSKSDFYRSNFLYSTVDLYSISSNVISGYTPDTLFFQGTPLAEEIVPTTVLAPIVEEKKETMEVTLKEVILILPMILVVVVSLIGLRKALRMLSNLLHQS